MTVLLLGTDFSTRSDRALRRAVLLARQMGLDLLIVAVAEDQSHHEEPPAQWQEPLAMLRRIQRSVSEHDRVRCDVEVRAGRPSDELAEAARRSGAALMIIGPHRRSLIRDAFGAVTAERIAQLSPVPLICANGFPAGPYRRLLIPVDFTDTSRQTIETLQSLEIARGAAIVLVHVYDAEAREMLSRTFVTAEDRRSYLSERAAEADEELRHFARSMDMGNVKYRVVESCGVMSIDITQVAADEAADLIVLSRSSKGAIAKTLLGSVTEDIIRLGELDVLLVPQPP